MKQTEIHQYKLLVALLSGWAALFMSKYSLEVDGVKIIVSLIFPLIVAMIWEYEYAIISGVVGLAIFIPFYIYPNRGYGNVLTTILYFILLIVDGKFITESDIKNSGLKIYGINIIYGIFFVTVNSSLYFKALSLNPEGFDEPIVREMAKSALAIQNVCFMCSVIMMTAIAKVLLRLPGVRQLYRLPRAANCEDNYKIILKTLALLIGFCLVLLLADALYASSVGTGSRAALFQLTTAGVIKVMLIISAAFVVCDYAIYSAMLRKESLNRLRKSEREIKQLNEGLERAVAERTKELKKAYDDLESFNYMVSHEIKAPIREIEAYISILEEDNLGSLKEASQDDIRSIKRVCCDTIALVQSMMEYSKMGYSIMKTEKINMAQMVTDCMRELMRSNPLQEIEYTVRRLPDVCGDRFLLNQAVFNILSNSVKFSAQKEKTRITVWGEEKDRKKFSISGITAPASIRVTRKSCSGYLPEPITGPTLRAVASGLHP